MAGMSKRLLTVAGLVSPGIRLADVGTDHGYVPIYLVKKGIITSAVAIDIGKGPLLRAEEHIRQEGLEGRIRTRLSDGLLGLEPGETDGMVAAGMGGGLVIHILSEGRKQVEKMKEFIIQPQSEIRRVREYLRDAGYRVVQEDMVREDGKFYPVMKAVRGREEDLTEAELEFGKFLLREGHPVLREYLEREERLCHKVLEELENQDTERAVRRAGEIRRRLALLKETVSRYYQR